MELKELLYLISTNKQFGYMMLGRLQQDLDNYIKDKRTKLWGITLEEHYKTMLAIYDILDPAPTWLTKEALQNYKAALGIKEDV
jgi:hypothetical protein